MKKHIMLIDHDQEQYAYLMDTVKTLELDCKVTPIKDYDAAIQILQFLTPDCLFMHIDITGVHALSRIRMIKELPTLRETRIVAFDGCLSATVIRDVLNAVPFVA